MLHYYFEKFATNILQVVSTDPNAYLKSLEQQLHDNDFKSYQMIIDVGAHFKYISNQTVAKGIANFYLNKNLFKYVLYFNEINILSGLNIKTGEITEIRSADASVIKEKIDCYPDECFIYFDQTHTFGANVPLGKGTHEDPAGPKAFVSFSPKDTETALFQGVMSARNLGGSESISFVGDLALFDYFKNIKDDQNPTKESILSTAKENLIKKIRQNSFMNVYRKIEAVYRRAVLNLIHEAKDIPEQQKIFAESEKFFFTSMDLYPSKLYLIDDEEQETIKVLEKMANNYEAAFQNLLRSTKKADKSLSEEINKIIMIALSQQQEQEQAVAQTLPMIALSQQQEQEQEQAVAQTLPMIALSQEQAVAQTLPISSITNNEKNIDSPKPILFSIPHDVLTHSVNEPESSPRIRVGRAQRKQFHCCTIQ
jgi:hypothetical protein